MCAGTPRRQGAGGTSRRPRVGLGPLCLAVALGACVRPVTMRVGPTHGRRKRGAVSLHARLLVLPTPSCVSFRSLTISTILHLPSLFHRPGSLMTTGSTTWFSNRLSKETGNLTGRAAFLALWTSRIMSNHVLYSQARRQPSTARKFGRSSFVGHGLVSRLGCHDRLPNVRSAVR